MPEKGVPGVVVGLVPGEVVVEVVLVVVVVGEVPEPDLGRYWTPVAGQSDVAPSDPQISIVKRSQRRGPLLGLVGMNVPVCRLPLTS